MAVDDTNWRLLAGDNTMVVCSWSGSSSSCRGLPVFGIPRLSVFEDAVQCILCSRTAMCLRIPMMTQTSESDRQIKRGQLIFLPVASERIYKIK